MSSKNASQRNQDITVNLVRTKITGTTNRVLKERCIEVPIEPSAPNKNDEEKSHENEIRSDERRYQKSKIRTTRKSNIKCALKERILKEAPEKEYIVNEIVLGTVPGYPPWPARIIEIVGQTIKVEFFGTGEMCVN